KISVAQMGEAVLSGNIRFQDLDHFFKGKIFLSPGQGFVGQGGQGAARRPPEETPRRPGPGGVPVRKIWGRELRALAEGRPLKKWQLPQDVEIKFQEATEKFAQNAGR